MGARDALTEAEQIVRRAARPNGALLTSGRAAYYAWLAARARWQASPAAGRAPAPFPAVFIVGCGRSGTTILGQVLGLHHDVTYRFEPYAQWAAVDGQMDFLQLYRRGPARAFVSADDLRPGAEARFRRAMAPRPGTLLIEKSPLNALRIGALERLAPTSRYLHIVRDGGEVVRSIDRLARLPLRRFPGRRWYNEWWGMDDVKWRLLSSEGRQAGHLPEEVDGLESHVERGAYEWIVSLREIERWAPRLGERLLEVRYSDLVVEPRSCLERIARWAALDLPEPWLADAAARISSTGGAGTEGPRLPPATAAAFNRHQQVHGFATRAVPTADGSAIIGG